MEKIVKKQKEAAEIFTLSALLVGLVTFVCWMLPKETNKTQLQSAWDPSERIKAI